MEHGTQFTFSPVFDSELYPDLYIYKLSAALPRALRKDQTQWDINCRHKHTQLKWYRISLGVRRSIFDWWWFSSMRVWVWPVWRIYVRTSKPDRRMTDQLTPQSRTHSHPQTHTGFGFLSCVSRGDRCFFFSWPHTRLNFSWSHFFFEWSFPSNKSKPGKISQRKTFFKTAIRTSSNLYLISWRELA